MEQEQVQLYECCVVPYRITACGAEFCLVTPAAENRWEFPRSRVQRPADCELDVLQQAAHAAGLHGEVSGPPLGSFVATRQSQTRNVVGYLMRVDRAEDSWPWQQSHRRLWCLAEEARIRIRRKPLRRFIDLALHSMKNDASNAGSRHAS